MPNWTLAVFLLNEGNKLWGNYSAIHFFHLRFRYCKSIFNGWTTGRKTAQVLSGPVNIPLHLFSFSPSISASHLSGCLFFCQCQSWLLFVIFCLYLSASVTLCSLLSPCVCFCSPFIHRLSCSLLVLALSFVCLCRSLIVMVSFIHRLKFLSASVSVCLLVSDLSASM